MRKPICIDLFCGLWGWGEQFAQSGYDVFGFDVVNACKRLRRPIPAHCHLVLQDVSTLHGEQFRGATLIVASPPCPEFTRHMLPWTKRRNPPAPDLGLVEASFRIAREAGVPIVLENVREAQRWLGPARAHYGSRYLWGDVPPMLPYAEPSRKEHLSSSAVPERAKIPAELAPLDCASLQARNAVRVRP